MVVKYACSLLTAKSSLQPDRETGVVIVESGRQRIWANRLIDNLSSVHYAGWARSPLQNGQAAFPGNRQSANPMRLVQMYLSTRDSDWPTPITRMNIEY